MMSERTAEKTRRTVPMLGTASSGIESRAPMISNVAVDNVKVYFYRDTKLEITQVEEDEDTVCA